jgi:outer membrane murein-binding lipoprotein Lpp
MQMELSQISALLYVLIITLLSGCASKKRVEELVEKVRQNQSEIQQLKHDQEKTLECANKIASGLNDLVALVNKTDSVVSDNKKQLDDHGVKINELLKELSTIKNAIQNKDANSLPKAPVLKGVTLPDGSFIPNDVSKATNTDIKAVNKSEVGNSKANVPTYEERSAKITKFYQDAHIRDHITTAFLDYYKQMLPSGTSQYSVSRVLGRPDQVNFSGAWVYDGIVQRVDDATKTTYLKITFSDNGEVVSVE